MSKKSGRRSRSYRTKAERQLEEIYAEIPRIPDCTGACATACTGIAMFKGEWDRVTRSFGSAPRVSNPEQRCPMLAHNNRCMVYSVRPYICRVWGTTPVLACPQGCQPERWLSQDEATAILKRIEEVAGPEVAGPLGNVGDLTKALDLPGREARYRLMEAIKQRKASEHDRVSRGQDAESPAGAGQGAADPSAQPDARHAGRPPDLGPAALGHDDQRDAGGA